MEQVPTVPVESTDELGLSLKNSSAHLPGNSTLKSNTLTAGPQLEVDSNRSNETNAVGGGGRQKKAKKPEMARYKPPSTRTSREQPPVTVEPPKNKLTEPINKVINYYFFRN